MAAAPPERYPDVTSLAADVAAFRAGEPVLAAQEAWYERLWRVATKYRAAILLVAAYLVMRAAIAFFLRR